VRALAGYHRAVALIDPVDPGCHIDWALLAAIGRVESDHGRFGGNQLDSGGVARPGIIGIALDGTNGTARITDTDGGVMDGDTVYDRAVGPLQFLPGTWRVVGADADGDGVKNPQDMADAATAAAIYLCSGHGDLSQPAGLSAAIMRYNASDSYVRTVTAIADAYRHGVTALPASALPASGPPDARSAGSSVAAMAVVRPATAAPSRPGSTPASMLSPKPVVTPGTQTATPSASTAGMPAATATAPAATNPTEAAPAPAATVPTATLPFLPMPVWSSLPQPAPLRRPRAQPFLLRPRRAPRRQRAARPSCRPLLLKQDASPAGFPVPLESGRVTLTPEQTPEPYGQPDCEPDSRSDQARSWLSWHGLRFATGLATLVLALLGVTGLAWLTWGNLPTETYAPASPRSPALPAAAPPSARSRASVAAGASRLQPDPAWVDRMAAGVTGIPARALMAYARASLLLSAEQPACRAAADFSAGSSRTAPRRPPRTWRYSSRMFQ